MGRSRLWGCGIRSPSVFRSREWLACQAVGAACDITDLIGILFSLSSVETDRQNGPTWMMMRRSRIRTRQARTRLGLKSCPTLDFHPPKNCHPLDRLGCPSRFCPSRDKSQDTGLADDLTGRVGQNLQGARTLYSGSYMYTLKANTVGGDVLPVA